jgi:putative transposase
VDEHGTELDILLQTRRDTAAVPELATVKHVFVKAAARVNNRAENSQQPTRRREHHMQGFRDRGDGPAGLVRSHESVSFGDTAPVSRANQAAA